MLVFARQLDGSLTSLVKAVDGLVKSHQAADLRGVVAFLTGDDAGLRPRLEALAGKENLAIPLTIAADGAAGPPSYRLDPKVLTQVVIYRRKAVVASFSLGSPTDTDIQAVVKAAEKVAGAN